MKLEAFGGAWKFSTAADRGSQWVLCDTRRGEEIAQLQWGKLNGISESDAVSGKCRFHGKLDNSEVAVESQNIYPFGGESVIDRTLTLRDKLLEVRVDIKPGKGEVIRHFELEDIVLPGEFTSAELLADLPEPGAVWQLQKISWPDDNKLEFTHPFALLVLTDVNGFQVELGSGGDWWRMLGAGNVSWQIIKTAGAVTVKRLVVDLPADEEVQRRAWRFNYYLAWGRKNSARLQASAQDIVLSPLLAAEVKSSCFRAPAVRKYLRKLIRQQQDAAADVILQLPAPEVCDDAGHLERPGKKTLRHWDWDELFALYSWGNRTLGEGRTLRLELPADSIFCQLPSGRYLSNPPGEAAVREL